MATGEFKEHPSTHGQQFWLLDALKKQRADGVECEAVLWDLAGQPDYRLIHGLFLDDADLALVLFNPADALEPLHGVEFWVNTLQRKKKCRIILVGARCDRGDTTLSEAEIRAFCEQRGISGGYVRTSALAGEGLENLLRCIRGQIDWDAMSATTTTATFKRIKDFVLNLKEDERAVLYTWADLHARLQATDADWAFSDSELQTAVGHLAKHGYVKILRTSQGNQQVLLTPELLNNLAASFVLEARRNPKGLGALEESKIQHKQYHFPELQDLSAAEQEILPDAVTGLFLENHIAFREFVGRETFLIFPALINQKKPLLSDIETHDDVSYTVRGAVENVYAALVVLLGYTNVFTRTNQWQNQAQYEVGTGEVCGFRQHAERDGEIDLVLYYCAKTSEASRTLFQGLFERFLGTREVEITRIKPVACSECSERIEREAVTARLRKDKNFILCGECGERIDLSQVSEAICLDDQQHPTVEREHHTARQRTRFETALAWLTAYVAEQNLTAPTCFISYTRDDAHWVQRFFTPDLRKAGLQTDHALTRSDVVIPVGTPRYRQQAENKTGDADFAGQVKQIAVLCREDRLRLLAVLEDLLPATFDKVLFVYNPPPAHLSAGSQAQRAMDLIRYAESRNELAKLQTCIEQETGAKRAVVLPVLLAGNPDAALPEFIPVEHCPDFRREADYFRVLFDLVLSLYRIPFEHDAVRDLRESLVER